MTFFCGRSETPVTRRVGKAEGFPAACDGLQLFLGMDALRVLDRIHQALLV
jgi:hypothetical protein